MKKILAMILVLLMTLTLLVACKKDDVTNDDLSNTNTPAGTTAPAGETGINHDPVQGVEKNDQYGPNGWETPAVGFGG